MLIRERKGQRVREREKKRKEENNELNLNDPMLSLTSPLTGVAATQRQGEETMTFVSAGHIMG